ncbi:hypothetical protein FB45DRAFT_974803 [Roridomyces roridus]|uniref:Integrase core domain-containing protein n=1 Tax=Roridomyces roridus TaxID=1738132 RepID=A0AAD7CEM3_9AGAR|nr:hypothetical protein FB45DRAFT_974803 [Roridomyces roridus]
MIVTRGLGRASFIWGSSTHNTRIERLWVEVGSQFARRWRAFFYRLEALHGLDRTNPHHLWLLHALFLDFINEDCEQFREEWNCHPISGEGHDMSPEVQNGMYVDEHDKVHPSILERYYGVHGAESQRDPDQTGAGQLDDEEVPQPDYEQTGYDSDELDEQVEEAHSGNFHPEPVVTPKHDCPFSDEETLELFKETFVAAEEAEIVPGGYGLLPDEWADGTYPAYEVLKSGRRSGRQLRIALPDAVWRPRAEMWGRGLSILNQINYHNEQ